MEEVEAMRWGQTSRFALGDERIAANLRRRDQLMRSLREYLHDQGFVEVDTPILRYYEDPTDNPPFVTLGPGGYPRLHLRTCPEEYTRRCACLFGKAFEVGKCFRNERTPSGGDRRIHLPEFTMVEIYEADLDLDASLDRIEGVVRAVVGGVQTNGAVTYQQRELDFTTPFRRVRVLDSLDESGNDEARAFAAKHRSAEPRFLEGEDRVVHRLIHEHVKPSLVQPTFLTHFPKSADQYPDRFIGNEVQRAELVVSCMEVGEIGALQPDWDVLQRHATAAVRERHGHTATTHLVDVDYLAEIKAFDHAVGGGAIGIDRLLMLLCDTKDMREVVWYPLVGKFHEGR